MSSKRLKVGLVLTSDFLGTTLGGGLPTVKIFLKYAKERSFDIWLLGSTASKDEPIGQVSSREIYGVKYPFIPLFHLNPELNRRPLLPIRVRAFLSYIARRSMIDKYQFDLLYLHAPEALPLFFRKRQPILYHIHGIQEGAALYSRYSFFRSRLFLALYQWPINYILRHADEFIDIDDESYEIYTSRFPERKDRFHLLPTAIDIELFRPLRNKRLLRQQYGLPQDDRIILYVGRLSQSKGVDLIIQAFARLSKAIREIALAIAGEGEEWSHLKGIVKRLGLVDRVFFLGRIPHEELPQVYNSADVVVVASVYDTLVLVILEALACGVPVVSTPVGIAPKVIKDGQTGFIIDERTPEHIATKLKEGLGLALDPETRKQCVQVAAEYAETSRQICDIIENMLKQRERLNCSS